MDRQEKIDELRGFFGPEPIESSGKTISQLTSQQDPDAALVENMQRYASAVNDSLDRPVIASAAAAEQLNDNSLMGRYSDNGGNTYITPRQFLGELNALKWRNDYFNSIQGEPNAAHLRVALIGMNIQRENVAEKADAVGGMLAGSFKSNDPELKAMHSSLIRMIHAHKPGEQYSFYDARTDSEQGQMEEEYGSGANYRIGDRGRMNHEAVRLTELYSATSGNYPPATTMAQVQRGIGGLVAPVYNTMTGNSNRLMGEPFNDMSKISETDGKYGYAADVYFRSASDDDSLGPVSVFDNAGRAKYGQYDAQNSPVGLGNAMMENTSFPYAALSQRLRAIDGTDAGGLAQRLAVGPEEYGMISDLRDRGQRITPTIPDGVDKNKFKTISNQQKDADTKLAGWRSAYAGPKLADLYNSTIGQVAGKTDRTYLSPFGDTVASVPGQSVADPANLFFNAVPVAGSLAYGAAKGALTGGVAGATKGALISGLKSALRTPFRLGEDTAEELKESAIIEAPMHNSVLGYITPESNNMLMGTKNPNDSDYDDEFNRRSINQMQKLQEAGRGYSKLLQ
jgi:hypothetical protein